MMKTLKETSVGDYFLSYDEKHQGKVFVVEGHSPAPGKYPSYFKRTVTARPVLFLNKNRLEPSASSHSPITFEIDTEVSVVRLEIKLVTDF